MRSGSVLSVDLRQMIIAIETAVSLVGMNDTNHGKRVAFIASQLGQELGYGEQDLEYLFELGLIHDCGVSTEQMHAGLVNHFDWDEAHIHCEIGYRLLSSFKPLAAFALPVLHHHTHWADFPSLDVADRDAWMANLVFLADRIDVIAYPHYGVDILLQRDEILASIRRYSGSYFSPEFVDAFALVQRHEAFWIALEDRHITRYIWDMGNLERQQPLTLQQIKQLSMILAYIVDQKSPFTTEHSLRVADLSKYLAHNHGLSQVQCDKIEIAALLHDLGKLHTPDRILEKAGPLSATERAIMHQHSFETYEILRHIKGLGDLARWAAYHHEGVNGGGYPFHPHEKDLSIEARIIAVADIFQALVQQRPYREGLELSAVLDVLDEMAVSRRVDIEVVELVKCHAAECFEIARGNDAAFNQPYIDFSCDNGGRITPRA
ncbi:phosphodiesterase [Marinobacterium zhoushanense]|uniref:Phosphodiesterase n=1 Tax=Marinobacterium zhoushanense TaxID=1679163 RepID=A0ABQ1KNF5_9GAMM|nr:HD domain-containing phosphohydrolase [Marinobacterium zhoushanense]GGC04685.1 phosphodiesterase [Marinobacterium zhoushanense]